MLQIIIWLGCLYLVLKGLQLLRVGLSASAGSGLRMIGFAGLAIALVGSVTFLMLANNQAISSTGAIPSLFSYDSRGAAERAWDDASPEVRAKVQAEMDAMELNAAQTAEGTK